ncbi:DMT family transporter [Jannaschia formosa]|uniref:DMT family transporter n=1 Tax=Jannaschia formosa TaxID=2259592 RepID=UPI000E1C3496|nr:DMT family transporter [Jannaschia formosa]TFL18662.1 DMT family transporter [Jannaschia formosa]
MTDNTRGALFMMGSMATFTLNDACMKWLAQGLPTFQVVTLRGIAATTLLLLLARATGALAQPIPRGDRGRVALRVAAEAAAFLPFIIALTHMPLANITAILQVLPLTIAAAGALFLGETVGPRRWTAIALGLVGVLLIVRPGTDGFNEWSLLAITTVVIITGRELLTRKLSPGVPSLKVATFTAAAVTALGALLSARTPWEMPATGQGAVIALAALFVLSAYVMSILAMRSGEMSAVAPFRYSAMLWGLLLGVTIFGERPDVWTLTGAALILAAGMFTLWREGRVPKPVPH